jgi:pyruvate ferredoxin oxidoreductase gamma subunit
MSLDFHLPKTDDLGFCNVLMSALGGDGANMAGKLLYKIGCTHFGLDGGYDARYGSEKKGTATDVSVRFCNLGTPVRQSGPTTRPHYLVAFHDDLIQPLDLGAGLHPDAVCIVNSVNSPDSIRRMMKFASGKIVCLDATRIAKECNSRLNMPLFASLCHELGFSDDEVMRVIAEQWPRMADANISAYSTAVSQATTQTFQDDGLFVMRETSKGRGPIGWRNMHNGGTVDALTHSTINRDNRIAGRGHVPKFDEGACISCGICLTVCSDPGGLLWREGKMQGIDELYCKGCMRCVEVCPSTKKGRALTTPVMKT